MPKPGPTSSALNSLRNLKLEWFACPNLLRFYMSDCCCPACVAYSERTLCAAKNFSGASRRSSQELQFFFQAVLPSNPLRNLCRFKHGLEDFRPKDWKLLKAERECSVSFNGPSWRSFLNLGWIFSGKGPGGQTHSGLWVSTYETTCRSGLLHGSEHLADLHLQNSECCSLSKWCMYLGKTWRTPPQVNKWLVSKSRWQVPFTAAQWGLP